MPKFIYIMSYFFCELSIKIKVPLLSVVSDCISVPNIILYYSLYDLCFNG